MELLENQMKQYNWEQQQIDHMKVSLIMVNDRHIVKSVCDETKADMNILLQANKPQVRC